MKNLFLTLFFVPLFFSSNAQEGQSNLQVIKNADGNYILNHTDNETDSDLKIDFINISTQNEVDYPKPRVVFDE